VDYVTIEIMNRIGLTLILQRNMWLLGGKLFNAQGFLAYEFFSVRVF